MAKKQIGKGKPGTKQQGKSNQKFSGALSIKTKKVSPIKKFGRTG